MMNVPGLFSQEAPEAVISGGIAVHNDSKSRNIWYTGRIYDFRLKIKRTDFGAIFAEIGYMKFKFNSANSYEFDMSLESTEKKSFLTGITTEINMKHRFLNVNWCFGLGTLYEKLPLVKKFDLDHRDGYLYKEKDTNFKYYFCSSIGLSRKISKNFEIGLNTGFLFSMYKEARGLWSPAVLDARIYF